MLCMNQRLRYTRNVKDKRPWEEYLNERHSKIKETQIKKNDRNNLANQFIQLRKNRKCSQNEMAHLLSITQSVISRIENGWDRISLNTLMKISKGLGVKIVISANSVTLITNE